VNWGKLAYELVAMGASAGGLNALCHLLRLLPDDFAVPIAIVQHRARESALLPGLLQDCTALRVVEVEDKQPIEPHHVYVAPPDYHLLVDHGAFALSVEELVLFSRPSIDVFFDSAADAYGAGVIGIVLTGANRDGSSGLRNIVGRGGLGFIQDPATAEVDAMPSFAREAVPQARVLPLEQIAEQLARIDRQQRERVGEAR
jgi:two-component system chemotaxis response regulator CheB